MKKERLFAGFMLLFLLGIRNGYITLWKEGDPEPIRQFSYKAAYLPVPDQRSLEQGIIIDHPQTLAQILEDYLS